jgi:hypothetical protein
VQSLMVYYVASAVAHDELAALLDEALSEHLPGAAATLVPVNAVGATPAADAMVRFFTSKC